MTNLFYKNSWLNFSNLNSKAELGRPEAEHGWAYIQKADVLDFRISQIIWNFRKRFGRECKRNFHVYTVFGANIAKHVQSVISLNKLINVVFSQQDWRTIWHRHQFDTGVNLTPDQFDTKSTKESIWHRSQFDTKSVKESIWHQECKRVNLTPGPIWHQECKRDNLTLAPIWHRHRFDTGTNLTPRV